MDILIIDAFNSDAIPVHLLTEEAFKEYFRVLRNTGVVLVHISNKYLDLRPVLAGIADQLNIVGYSWADLSVSAEEQAQGKETSHWVLLGKDSSVMQELRSHGEWQELGKKEVIHWTDQYSSIYGILSSW